MSNKNRQQSFNKHKEVKYTDEQILTNAPVIDQTPEDKKAQVTIATPIPIPANIDLFTGLPPLLLLLTIVQPIVSSAYQTKTQKQDFMWGDGCFGGF